MTKRIGVFLPNWIGDVAMATPGAVSPRSRFRADTSIVGIHRPYVAEVLAGTPWLDELVPYHPRSKDRELKSWSVARRLRQLRLDSAIIMPNSLRAAAIAWISGAKRRIGYIRYGRGPLLTDKLKPPRDGKQLTPVSAVDYYLSLAYAAGCPEEEKRMELATTVDDERTADQAWDRLQLGDPPNVVVLNTGGAYGAAKNWPDEYYVQLARRIVTQLDAMVLIICGPAEREAVERIERAAAHPQVRSLANVALSIGPLKACLRRAGLMVTTDSGPRHLAVALGVPVISLFGSIDPRWSATYHPLETQLMHKVDCGPCGQRVCPLKHHRCMRDLTVDRVFDEVTRRWQSPDRQSAA